MRADTKKWSVVILSVLIVLTVFIIFGNSLKGPEESKEQSDAVIEVVRPIIDPDKEMTEEEVSFLVRKSGHFVEYLILGIECALLTFIIFGRSTPQGGVYSAFGCLFIADIDEFIQSFTDRGSKVADVLLDFGGAITGIAIGFAVAYAARYVYRKNKGTRKRVIDKSKFESS